VATTYSSSKRATRWGRRETPPNCRAGKPARPKGETFYRPPGGGLQFGEPAADAVARELDEELGWTVRVTERLAVVENIFTFNGTQGHEYDVVFAVEPEDEAVYDQEAFVGTETGGIEFRVCWKPIEEFRGEDASPLYPQGLLDGLA
jgi:ADP-ribose pyrophosphatase YjhB (NUDIX family)